MSARRQRVYFGCTLAAVGLTVEIALLAAFAGGDTPASRVEQADERVMVVPLRLPDVCGAGLSVPLDGPPRRITL